jgi:hypothetical protein
MGTTTPPPDTSGDKGTTTPPPDTSGDKGTQVAPAKKIKITIDSSPSGAMVFVGNEKEPRGKTPYTFEVDEKSGILEVKLFQKKYKWEKLKVPTDAGDQSLDVRLEKEKKSGGGGSSGGKKGGDGGDEGGSDDTMNPFKKKKP